jgi:hypothetical protein
VPGPDLLGIRDHDIGLGRLRSPGASVKRHTSATERSTRITVDSDTNALVVWDRWWASLRWVLSELASSRAASMIAARSSSVIRCGVFLGTGGSSLRSAAVGVFGSRPLSQRWKRRASSINTSHARTIGNPASLASVMAPTSASLTSADSRVPRMAPVKPSPIFFAQGVLDRHFLEGVLETRDLGLQGFLLSVLGVAPGDLFSAARGPSLT